MRRSISVCSLSFVLLAAASSAANPGKNGAQLSCVVLPSQKIAISSAVPGIVKAVLVERGARVRKGQPLLTLDAEVEEAQAQLAQAKASFAQRKLARNKDMIHKRLISEMEGDQVQTDAQMAQYEYLVAQRTAARRTTYSPIDAVVVSRKTEPGQYVGTEPVMELARLDPLHIELVMRVSAYGSIKLGMPVTIALGFPVNGTRQGRVSIVDRLIDARSGTFGVRVDLPNGDLNVPAGVDCDMK